MRTRFFKNLFNCNAIIVIRLVCSRSQHNTQHIVRTLQLHPDITSQDSEIQFSL